MVFQNLPIEFDEQGLTRLQHSISEPYAYPAAALDISPALIKAITQKNLQPDGASGNPLSQVGGGLAFHCTVNLKDRKVVETASMATLFRGYEAILRGRDLRDAGLVSSTAAGICGGVHATASALCLEMALGLKPPPLGILVRNLLLSCQYLNDNPMHLFLLSGPDYSEAVIRQTNPEIWAKAEHAPAQFQALHGYETIGAIMADLNRSTGKLYLGSLRMIQLARQAYALLGGKYPHSESIIPGGVSITPTMEMLDAFADKLVPFYDYAKQCIGIWDDVFDFMYEANPQYQHLGEATPTMVDFGQWDHEDYYDATYANCNTWGEKRWSTPGAIVNGRLMTTRLTDLNIGLEEFVDHSYYAPWDDYPFQTDPQGNPLSPNHPWNKTIIPQPGSQQGQDRYSWGCAPTWDRHTFEVGAYARMYLSALAQKLPPSRYVEATGRSLVLHLAKRQWPELRAEWSVPARWNAFERNRARAYAIAFNLMVTIENIERTKALLAQGEQHVAVPLTIPEHGRHFGAGFWGAGRGFLAHWAVIDDGVLSNYQISIPSRINASPRSPWGELGACERAVLNTPIIETNFRDETDFKGIDILRAIQSFDPCMPCTTHLRVEDTGTMLDRVVTTRCAI